MTETLTVSLDTILGALPKFCGDATLDIEEFLNAFDAVVKDTQLGDPVKILLLKTKISGRARDKMQADEDIKNETIYANLQIKLRKKFKLPVNFLKAQEGFMSLKQKPDQSVEDFALELEQKSKEFLKGSGHEKKEGAKDFVHDLKFNKFLDGIRPDLAFEIRKADLKDFEAALKLAKIIENAHMHKHEEINAIDNKKKANDEIYEYLINTQSKQAEEIKSLQTKLEELKLSKASDNNQTKQETQKFCDICKKTSHITDTCWYNAKIYPTNNLAPIPSNSNAMPTYQSFPRHTENSMRNSYNDSYNRGNGRQTSYNRNAYNRGQNRGNNRNYRRPRANSRFPRGHRNEARNNPRITYPAEPRQNLNR